MSDQRRHRGPHPKDHEVFVPSNFQQLRAAAGDLAWLLDRGYATKPSLQLVGNHHQLHARQRHALQRTVSNWNLALARRQRHVSIEDRRVVIDGFNAVINVEAALSGGLMVRGCDGFYRNLASKRNAYRLVKETERAVTLLIQELKPAREVIWYLDDLASNCGRLATVIRSRGGEVILAGAVDNKIAAIATEGGDDGWVAATADTGILDRVAAAVDLPALVFLKLKEVWEISLENIRDKYSRRN